MTHIIDEFRKKVNYLNWWQFDVSILKKEKKNSMKIIDDKCWRETLRIKEHVIRSFCFSVSFFFSFFFLLLNIVINVKMCYSATIELSFFFSKEEKKKGREWSVFRFLFNRPPTICQSDEEKEKKYSDWFVVSLVCHFKQHTVFDILVRVAC